MTPAHPAARPGGDLPDDTILDAIAAQARTRPPLPVERVAGLLAAARDGDPGAVDVLVEHHLHIPLAAGLARGTAGVDIADLYQEGSTALVAAVHDQVARGGDAGDLAAQLAVAVAAHLDASLAEVERLRLEEEAFVRDARLLETAELELGRRLERPATPAEVAAILGWDEARVALVIGLVGEARHGADAELVAYLDEDETSPSE